MSSASAPLQPAQDGDEVTGEKDLIALHTLGNIANWVLGPQFRPGNYEQGLTGLGGRPDWRKGPGMELAPLGNTFPSSKPPSFEPFSQAVLDQAFNLQQGSYQLPEADKGIPVLSGLGGAPAAPPAAAAASAHAAPRSFKFKVRL